MGVIYTLKNVRIFNLILQGAGWYSAVFMLIIFSKVWHFSNNGNAMVAKKQIHAVTLFYYCLRNLSE
jgi:hypothetical protein